MGPLSLEAGLARLRVAGSGHPSLFIGEVDRLPLWEHHIRQRQSPERKLLKGMFTHTHRESLYALQCWMKMVVVWLYYPQVPHHVIAVVSALLISAVPLGLYNWETADSRDPTFTPRSPSRPSRSRWQTPLTRDSSSWFAIYMWILDTFISWQTLHCLVLWSGDKAKQLFFFFFNFPKLHTVGLVTAKVDKSFSFVPKCSINQLHRVCLMEADKSLGYREQEKKQPGFVFCCSGFHTH